MNREQLYKKLAEIDSVEKKKEFYFSLPLSTLIKINKERWKEYGFNPVISYIRIVPKIIFKKFIYLLKK